MHTTARLGAGKALMALTAAFFATTTFAGITTNLRVHNFSDSIVHIHSVKWAYEDAGWENVGTHMSPDKTYHPGDCGHAPSETSGTDECHVIDRTTGMPGEWANNRYDHYFYLEHLFRPGDYPADGHKRASFFVNPVFADCQGKRWWQVDIETAGERYTVKNHISGPGGLGCTDSLVFDPSGNVWLAGDPVRVKNRPNLPSFPVLDDGLPGYLKIQGADNYLYAGNNGQAVIKSCDTSGSDANCQWVFELSATRPYAYYIKHVASGKYLHAHGGLHNDANLTLHACTKTNDHPNCQWWIQEDLNNPGTVAIVGVNQGVSVHAAGGNEADNKVTAHICGNGGRVENCRWRLTKTEATTPRGMCPYGRTCVTSEGSPHFSDGATVVKSPDDRYAAVMQGDCNFVVYGGGGPVWASNTWKSNGDCALVVQGDGNLVIYNSGTAIWSSATGGSAGTRALSLTNDGVLELRNASGSILWQSQ